MLRKSFYKIKTSTISALGIYAVVFFLAVPDIHANTVSLANINPLKVDTWQELIGLIIRAIIGLTGTATLLVLVWGGFLWLTAAGEEKRIKAGISTIVWAVIGLGVIFGAYAILDFIIKKALGAG